ncbi:hypothetical protein [uncultured Nonlabens sp.]|uniref:hypothetical protein n=1 Tax=uncultured Nonlabens sp. TaxID=859306 RepID=UPI0026189B61|nr:hypothetical protein [uncultured Nonlabens sp.]
MALEIKNIEGVICLKGTVSSSHTPEVLNFFKSLLRIDKRVVVNLCGLQDGQDYFFKELKFFKESIDEDQEFIFYGATQKEAVQLYSEINNPINFYNAAA